MPDLSSVQISHPVDVTVDVGAETFTLRFDREAITPHLIDGMAKAVDAGDFLASARMLAAVILEWDLTDEGQPFPPTVENLARLSMSTLGAISLLIGDASVPSDAEGNASRNTLSTPQQVSSSTPESPLNGQEPSQSQKPSVAPSVT